MTVTTPTQLNAMTFPLHGVRLIEASAGTGKTFTIASLYLRLLLGHGDDVSRHRDTLTVDQILVVTFTEAATAELRDRIRSKIHQTRFAFARAVHHADYQSGDPIIDALLTETKDHQVASQILLNAERSMDEAAIFTIHGFCQRMLTQNAFESGAQFESEFITDESKLMHQVVADFWRRRFYRHSKMVTNGIYECWPDPRALLSDIDRHLTGVPKQLTVEPLTESLDDLYQKGIERIEQLKSQWLEHCHDVEALITDSGVDKRSFSKKNLPNWLEQITAWAESDTDSLHLHDKIEKFSQSHLEEKTKKGEVPTHRVFEAIDRFLSQPLEIKQPLLALAITECRNTLQQMKQKKNWLSFDDLLTQLSAAVENRENHALIERIRAQYPVALIDEFQDTDPLQYAIFSHIYHDQPQCGLFMIGDPKQAIYAFRGADIFTYIQARRQVVEHYTLDTNWRSTSEMVNAVNSVFEHADCPFIYDDDIPFYPVKYNPINAEKKRWVINDQLQPAMTFWLQESESDEPLSSSDYQAVMAEATAAQIQTILTESQKGTAYLQQGEQKEAIEAANIAVLVRNGSEGKLIRQALAKQGIASVYLSNRDCVFSSLLAKDVLRLLQAIITPMDSRKVRSALACSLFGHTAEQLHQLTIDEIQWEQVVNEFRAYRKHWQQHGVMAMLHQIMTQKGISERLLAESTGERQLTDLLHLGELLQKTSQTLDSDYALLRWLSESIAEPNGDSEEQTVRLESERSLVQIVTIHKSKGLEYDVVFLPFALSYRATTKNDAISFYDPERQSSILDLHKEETSIEKAEQERLAESLRLIYVALTRAVYACYIGVAPIAKGRAKKGSTGVHLSGLGYLIQQGKEGESAEFSTYLQKLIERHLTKNNEAKHQTSMVIEPPPQVSEQRYQAIEVNSEPLKANSLNTPINRHWWVTSYSGLMKQGNRHQDGALERMHLDVDSADDSQNEPAMVESELSMFTFPRGARAGTFLHSVFEAILFSESAESEHNTQVITTLLNKENYGLEWLPILQAMIDRVLNARLDGDELCLSKKNNQQLLVEMEFLLPITLLNSALLNKTLTKHDAISAKAGELGFSTVSGMLKGFIDLVFEHQGKYYILDWKSNHLGDTPEHYNQPALMHAMQAHRYDFQYQLYALALHRYLNSRLANYDYDTHFGGVYYLFLRGIEAESTTGDVESANGIFQTKPSRALLEELEQLIEGEVVHA